VGFQATTYSCADACIQLSGTLDSSRVLAPIDGLNKYVLNGGLIVAAEATLTIPSGVEIQNNESSNDIRVDGQLNATGVAFHWRGSPDHGVRPGESERLRLHDPLSVVCGSYLLCLR